MRLPRFNTSLEAGRYPHKTRLSTGSLGRPRVTLSVSFPAQLQTHRCGQDGSVGFPSKIAE